MNKVALLFSISHKAPNGASRFVQTFVDKQSVFLKKQIDFHVYARDNYKECDYSPDNISLKRKHKIKGYLFKIINHSAILTVLYDYFAEARSARIIVRNYLKQSFDDKLVHCQEDQTGYYLLKHKKEFKVIQSFHSDGNDYSVHMAARPGLNSWLGHKYMSHRFNYIIKNAARLGFVSKRSMETFKALHPEVANKLFYVYNGISERPLTHNYSSKYDNKVRFICVASLNDNKNQKSIIEALLLLPDKIREEIELIIVGDGESRKKLEDFVYEHKLNNVSFKGNCSNVTEQLSTADVFILVSKSEGLPVAIIEALREGLPVIGSDVGGIPEEVIDGLNGFVVQPEPKEIAVAINKMVVLGNAGRESMGKKSYDLFIERFSENAMFDSYANIYNETILGNINND